MSVGQKEIWVLRLEGVCFALVCGVGAALAHSWGFFAVVGLT
jgi:hypothetical protein